jgi:hypothetical protein
MRVKWIALLALLMLAACEPCDFKNASGDCMSEKDYIRMVAHDAAHDALIDMLNYCASHSYDSECKALRRD